MKQCKTCGTSLVKYPLFKRVSKGDYTKKVFIWQNLFKMEWRDFFITLGIIAILLGSAVMLNETKEIQKHPCQFCEDNGCCSQPIYCYEDYVGDKPIVSDYPISYNQNE